MRCVSYTRTTSCKEDGKIPADIIKQQDQHIQEYLKKQGWTLSAKYCDRKKDTEENTAFEELTKDGIDRKFDINPTVYIRRQNTDSHLTADLNILSHLVRHFYNRGHKCCHKFHWIIIFQKCSLIRNHRIRCCM